MRDQAETLRIKMLESQGELGRSIAVVSGKGGVGKSNFIMNFAARLLRQGKSSYCRYGYWHGQYSYINGKKCTI